MRRADDLYKWGIFVAHNAAATPGAGSCIFMHIWKNSSTATIGCTAMAERHLVRLLRWLDPAAQPLLVQMPRADYAFFQDQLRLPHYPDPTAKSSLARHAVALAKAGHMSLVTSAAFATLVTQ
jgi:hypothetical protein